MALKDIIGQDEPQWEQVAPASTEGGSEMLKPEVGDEIVGTFMGYTEHQSNFPGPDGQRPMNKLFKIKQLDGADVVLWNKGNLWYQLQSVPSGTLVKLERFPDEKSKKGFTVQNWGVFTAATN